jgi:hypothetical protein
MVQKSQANIKGTPFYAADIANIAAGATDSSGSSVLKTEGLDFVTVELETTGKNAGSAGVVTANLVFSTNYNWSAGTGDFSTDTEAVTVTVAGTAKKRSKPLFLDLRGGIRAVKITTIVNGDGGQAIGPTNAYMSASQ